MNKLITLSIAVLPLAFANCGDPSEDDLNGLLDECQIFDASLNQPENI
ncbi:MAG: hypothetical protein ACI85Q_001997 [Salibacteraceae bacterium]|jgi:hypothetical protein